MSHLVGTTLGSDDAGLPDSAKILTLFVPHGGTKKSQVGYSLTIVGYCEKHALNILNP